MPISFRTRALGIALGLLLVASSAHAQQSDPTPEHLAAARDLLMVMQVESAMLATFEATIDAQIAQAPAMAQMRGVMVAWASKYMTMEYMGDQLARAYAEEFTQDELGKLAAFYRTALGVKLAGATPALARKGAMVGAQVAQEHTGELQQMIQNELGRSGGSVPPR